MYICIKDQELGPCQGKIPIFNGKFNSFYFSEKVFFLLNRNKRRLFLWFYFYGYSSTVLSIQSMTGGGLNILFVSWLGILDKNLTSTRTTKCQFLPHSSILYFSLILLLTNTNSSISY